MTSYNGSTRYRAILFDAGQTLLRVEPSVGHVYAKAARPFGVEASPDELEEAFRRLWSERRRDFPDNRGHRASEAEEREWWRKMVDGVFRVAGRREDFGEHFDEYFAYVFDLFSRPEPWHVFEDVCPALERLRNMGLRLGVVSNWDMRLHVLIERVGLKAFFEFILTSAEAGRRKPDPTIFRQALERLALPSEQVVYIGDSYEDDVVGAQEVGIMPLLLDRHQGRSRDNCLATLDDLPAWIQEKP